MGASLVGDESVRLTRSEALEVGAKRYRGSTCKDCGGNTRHTSSNGCVVCANQRTSEWRTRQRFADVMFVYSFYNADDELLYVGKTNAPYSRLHNHKHKTPWWSEVSRISWTQYPNPEFQRIMDFQPKYNQVGF